MQKISKTDISTICDFPVEHRNKFLKVALVVIQPKVQNRFKAMEKLCHDHNISRQKLNDILGIYIWIIRLFIETSAKEFNNKLIELGFTSDFIKDLPLITNRTEVIETISQLKRSQYGKLTALKWRIDISLSNSSLQKKVPVSVILSIQLKDGRKYVIEMDGRAFHNFRYNVALLLKEFTSLQSCFVSSK